MDDDALHLPAVQNSTTLAYLLKYVRSGAKSQKPGPRFKSTQGHERNGRGKKVKEKAEKLKWERVLYRLFCAFREAWKFELLCKKKRVFLDVRERRIFFNVLLNEI